MKQNMISTGIPKLDELLGGGIPKGFTSLITGVPGTNIELITKQFASSDNPVYISTDEPCEDIISTMETFSWDPKQVTFIDIAKEYMQHIINEESERVSIYEQRSKKRLKELIKIASTGTPVDKKEEEDYLAVLYNQLRVSADKKIIINTLDFFFEKYPVDEVMRVLKAGKVNISDHRGILILILTRGIHAHTLELQLESLSDCIIDLDLIQKGSNYERILTVKKMRNLAKKIGTVHYDIDNKGFSFENIERIL